MVFPNDTNNCDERKQAKCANNQLSKLIEQTTTTNDDRLACDRDHLNADCSLASSSRRVASFNSQKNVVVVCNQEQLRKQLNSKPTMKQCDLRRKELFLITTYLLLTLSVALPSIIVNLNGVVGQQQHQQQSNNQPIISSAAAALIEPSNSNSNNIAQQQQPVQQAHLGAQMLPPSSTSSHQNQNQNQHQQAPSNNLTQHTQSASSKRRTETTLLGAHFQPAFVLGARNRAPAAQLNFTHLTFDETQNGGSVYLGANNWLLQVGAASLRPEVALRTGPAPAGESQSARDCSPADCPVQQPVRVDLSALNLHHGQGPDLSIPSIQAQQSTLRPKILPQQLQQNYSLLAASHRNNNKLSNNNMTTTTTTLTTTPAAIAQSLATNNNFNKLLVIEPESRQLIACGSLNQGACRRHQLGALANFSELIPMPVVSNDEFSSNVASVVASSRSGLDNGKQSGAVLYVGATLSSRSDHLYREMVPSISARHLEPRERAMQIIERSFTETAKIDISFELRDYYLVNYVHSFQHSEHIYFATNQRKSPLRQLEEWGYISRLARLCLGDLSFQSYAEISLECRSKATTSKASNLLTHDTHYNLLQDASLIQASNQLAAQLGLDPTRAHSVLVGVFAQSKEHTLKSQARSAICLFPMQQIEATFNDNIASCLNGTSRTRDMNYIAGAVNDCPRATGKPANLANTCNEPIKLNGSIPLVAQPVISFDSDLLTSVAGFWAPSSPVSSSKQHSSRQHQILLAGTSEGELKRIALLDSSRNDAINKMQPRGHLLDSVLISEQQEPILSDMLLLPPEQDQLQSALVATANKLVKLRVNGCRLQSTKPFNTSSAPDNGQLVNSCQACAALEDPLCGWCSTAGACTSRHACLQKPTRAHAWQPFDQIRCTDYEPISPRSIPLQASSATMLEVNVPLNQQVVASSTQDHHAANKQQSLAWKLAQAQFQCHFDYLSLANRSQLVSIVGAHTTTGAHTKATQARLNLHTGTVSIGCPLPSVANRPSYQATGLDEFRVRLLVKLDPQSASSSDNELEQALGMDQWLKQLRQSNYQGEFALAEQAPAQIERTLVLYDCSQLSTCSACTSSVHSCAWCPLTSRCTFNSSHAEFGCAASALLLNQQQHHSTTPSSSSHNLRPSHLTNSLHPNQASMFGLGIERPSQCPVGQQQDTAPQQTTATNESQSTIKPVASSASVAPVAQQEILVAHQSRRSIVIQLKPSVLPQIVNAGQLMKRSGGQLKVECLFELEEASRARVSARLVQSAPPESPNSPAIVCQEMTFAYGDEVAIQRAQVQVLMNDNQLLETSELILYKCHLFGVNPPALMSSLIMTQNNELRHQAGSSAAWRAHELFNQQLEASQSSSIGISSGAGGQQSSDCSLCANIERKFRCQWCQSGCMFADHCPLAGQHQASSCPPPRIDSIRPTSGPLEGGTLITIEGSNLGSSEREIQDKITVGGLPCHLIMYSVSTRIVCRTSPASARMPTHSTVYVGNRAGISSAHEMFHYKPVHLTGVTPSQGPVSGGTKLTLSGSNLNIGSRTQIFLDEIPCYLETHDMSSNQISCITAPNLELGPMQISRLTLMIDNSTHHYPHPFTYQPDPIITAIEPAESFISGGRLILISGQHLSSPQSIKLMVYQEHKHLPINGTTCMSKNDTLITCLTPAIPRSLVAANSYHTHNYHQHYDNNNNNHYIHPSAVNGSSMMAAAAAAELLSYQGGGFKLRMFLMMDDVKSVRNLDDYYHHLPHYLTYFEDPRLYRLQGGLVEYAPELVIEGDFLQMNQLDQDILITIGARQACLIKSIEPQRLVCEPPAKVEAQYDLDSGRLLERANLAIVGLIGSHLSYPLGHMQYTSQQYLPAASAATTIAAMSGPMSSLDQQHLATNHAAVSQLSHASNNSTTGSTAQALAAIFVLLSAISFFVAGLVFAYHRSRQNAKYERKYKRIQLQMGSLDINGQPIIGSAQAAANVGLFAQHQQQPMIIAASGGRTNNQHHSYIARSNQCASGLALGASPISSRAGLVEQARRLALRALDRVTGGSRLANAFNNQQHSQSSLVIGGARGAMDGSLVGTKGAASAATANNKLFYPPSSNDAAAAINSSTSPLFANNNDHFIQQQANNIAQHHGFANNQFTNHHLVLSKLTPNGKIVSTTSNHSTSATLQRINNDNQTTASLLSSGPVTTIREYGGYYGIGFASQANQQHGQLTNTSADSTSPLVSYSGNYTPGATIASDCANNNNTRTSASSMATTTTTATNGQQQQQQQRPTAANNCDTNLNQSSPSSSCASSTTGSSATNSNTNSAASSQQCSPGSSTRTPISSSSKQRLVASMQQQPNQLEYSANINRIQHHQQRLLANNQHSNQQQHHQHQSQQQLKTRANHYNSWAQEAPSTVLPYSVIEACNLTLEGKDAIKRFV